MLRAQVSDDGAPLSADSPARDAALWHIEPDHGLGVVRLLADQVSLHSGPDGSVIMASFSLGPAGENVPFRLVRQTERGCMILAIVGPLDLASAHYLTDAVDRLNVTTPGLRLILDLADLTTWDSFGLASLLTSQQHINAHPPARMVLTTLPSVLLHRLSQSGLADRFTLADTIDNAIGKLSHPQ
jgi:anti-anti-sigma factor